MDLSNSYKRILLKLSGESLMGSDPFGINQEACLNFARGVDRIKRRGVQIGIVVGGGNIFRGIHLEKMGLERTPADQMGMLATIINGIALQQALASISCDAVVLSAFACPQAVESYSLRACNDYFAQGKVLIFVGGTGNPYFTTDSAAALRASETKADILLKATKVDGVYDKDPLKYPDAKKYEMLTYSQALADNLEVMDATALALCRSNHIPILVFNMKLLEECDFIARLSQRPPGTIVKGD